MISPCLHCLDTVKTENIATLKCENIRIFYEYEVLIEISVLRLTVWHHEAPLSNAKL